MEQKLNSFRPHGPKQWNHSITKSCGDAKIELFPGARPPDTTFTSWCDLTLALVHLYGFLWNSIRFLLYLGVKNYTVLHRNLQKRLQEIKYFQDGTSIIFANHISRFPTFFRITIHRSWPPSSSIHGVVIGRVIRRQAVLLHLLTNRKPRITFSTVIYIYMTVLNKVYIYMYSE